jgi:cytidylate kinase
VAIKKFRIITISGESGAGKSSLLKELLTYLEPLGWKKIKIGDLFREFCHMKGYTVQEIDRVNPEIHREFDEMQAEILKTDSNIIIEGRMSGYLAFKTELQDIVKIYCELPLEIRARRFANREEITVQEAERKVQERDNKDLVTYKTIYNLEDYRDSKYYDLYLETTKAPDELARFVFDEINKLDNS